MHRWRSIFVALIAALGPHKAVFANDAERAFSIPKSDLSVALKRFSEQAGVRIVFDSRLVDGLESAAIDLSASPQEALAQLLDGAGLDVRIINDTSFAIVPQTGPAPAAPPVARPPQLIDPRPMRDEIIVTASYRAPSVHAGMKALYTLDGEQLRLNGAFNVSEPIYELPSAVATVSSANTALLISSGGLNLADLRGLGPERTLVLVNGRRYPRTSGGNGTIFGVDLNSIPAPFVEQIEIVNQGAGAAIGMEAVAGAVNVMLRDDIEGIAVTIDGGLSQRGDAGEYSVSVLGGDRFADDRGRFLVGLTHASDPSLLVDQRPEIASPSGFQRNGLRSPSYEDAVFSPGFGGSPFTGAGMISAVTTSAGNFVPLFAEDGFALSPEGDGVEPFVGSIDQLYNWTQGFAALPEIKRTIGYASGEIEFSPAFNVWAEFHIADSSVQSQIASSPVAWTRGGDFSFGDGIVLPVDHPFAPPLLQSTLETAVGQPVDSVVIERRFVELGPRRRKIDRRTILATFGVDGSLSDAWRYDFSLQFGRNRTRDTARGFADRSRVAIAADPAACATISGCVPTNFFRFNSITAEQAAFYEADPTVRNIRTREIIATVKATGQLYEYRNANANLTVGLEHRREALSDESDRVVDIPLGEFFLPGAKGRLAQTEAFANVTLPVVVDSPLTSYFEVGGAIRANKRDGGSTFLNVSGNARWAPVDGIELYAHAFSGGRAPNVNELFAAGPDTHFFVSDPCSGASAPAEGVLEFNCLNAGALGVPDGFVQTNPLALIRYFGNPALTAENVDSRLFGARIDIEQLLGDFPFALALSADWRRQHVRNAINLYGYRIGLEACYKSEKLSDLFCLDNPMTGGPVIERDPVTGDLLAVNQFLVNEGEIRADGLDARMQFEWRTDAHPLLEFVSADILYTFNNDVEYRFPREPTFEQLVGAPEFPRHQFHATAGLGSERLKTVWTVRRRGEATTNAASDNPAFRLPPVTYVDASFQWRPTGNTIVYAGVENLFDRDFPVVAGADRGYFFEHYDIVGRRFFAGLKAEF